MDNRGMKLKDSSNSASQTLASSDSRRLVRETLRISANLASAPPCTTEAKERPALQDSSFGGAVADQFLDSSLRLICCEEIDGRRWNYFAHDDGDGNRGFKQLKKSSSKQLKRNSIRAVSLQAPRAPSEELISFIRSYVVPDGFPNSVTPSYVPYMTWRALQHFFGGAMGVFTTQTLLNSIGVSRSRSTMNAVAVNWVLKEGAGRVGRMLFARQGKKFDYDLKQLRFTGDLLLELGAGLELATAAFPNLFLPLACVANVVKNVAIVASTSTRAPIYKAFAKGENIGDITAKGECVGTIADLLGTGLGIMVAKRNPPLVPTFALLSCGYMLGSYQEVKSIILHTLNPARFTVAVESFLKTGRVPTLQEGNFMENIVNLPWIKPRPIVLGPRFKEAFQNPNSYLYAESIFEKEKYIVTYNPAKGNIYALFKDQAKSDDILKAAFHAHVLLHIIQPLNQNTSSFRRLDHNIPASQPTSSDIESHITESYKLVSALYEPFKSKAKEQGWAMSDALLNPGRARLCGLAK
ncbi:protein root UVB sensitive 6-like isoform X2 [Andrographis paniculata]|uniref:protein root UVB sensitive 6-like isoform X2 n=1 Tax=Andrographis paniculata TaxID=175694 RepID=UPI0021E7F997|nr:protein root UVB sensitive 6-like isoform X2 [Andrographis paniculata]